MDDVADAAAFLFNQGGYEAVSIEAVAERLSVSRATLYRTVPTKEHLLGIVLERYTSDLGARVEAHLAEAPDPAAALDGLIRIQVDAAIRTKEYFTVLIGGAGVQADAYKRWLKWSRGYEKLWRDTVERAIEAGVLDQSDDPKLATRLILGMTLWVSRWYRKSEGYTAEQIAQTAVDLILAPSHRAAMASIAAEAPAGAAAM